MPWVEVLGNDIYYLEEGDGQPFVFLHGNSSCAEAWWQQFDFFRERYRVIAYDSVNHGHSSNSPRDEPETDRADELEAFLDAVGIERPILAGNSMGANTLLRWATRHPSDAAALIPSGMGVPPPGETAAPRQRGPLDQETLFLPIGDSLTDEFVRREPRMYERYLRIRSTATRIEAMRHPRQPSEATLAERAALAERVTSVTLPMLIVSGTVDWLRPWAEHLDSIVDHAEFLSIEGGPHNIYYERAHEYNDGVAAFLDHAVKG